MSASLILQSIRPVLLGAASITTLAIAQPALAGTGEDASGLETTSGIIIRDDLGVGTPPAAPADTGINGIGQMAISFGGGSVGLCTGTLINPRTVIFAGHCVNDLPAEAYGSNTGGMPISFGFNADNRPALINWITGGLKTNTANALYNVEQVWYDPRSVPLGFLEADVALATLDTPATDIPTWTLLFSPLTTQTHAIVTGYGSRGIGSNGPIGIDFRRRSAENMLSVLGSLDDVDQAIFGPLPPSLPQSLYLLDFDDPTRTSEFDFDVFPGNALAREGTTAGGDSGGPLVIDQKFNKPVAAAVLSGGSKFFEEQAFSTYGTFSFYQPLFLFWDRIVANNPYVYATNKVGAREWTDPRHWVQEMDPAYGIEVNGQLVNALPRTPALGVSGNTVKFGEVFSPISGEVVDIGLESTPPSGKAPFIPGGPGSTNFVPNNVVGNPTTGVKARYYDVTLAAPGITTLKSAITIDKLTVDGAHQLLVRGAGNLSVLGDFTQLQGWTQVDGRLKTGEALIAQGLFGGSGRFDPTYLTVVRGTVLPGGLGTAGTLTVAGDVILSSGATTLFELSRTNGDKIVVVGDADNPGIISLGGTAAFLRTLLGAAPRHGQSFEIISAEGGVDGTFDDVVGGIGVLRPELTYGADDVTVTLKAGKFKNFIANFGATELAFAGALDSLRANSYANLSSVYGIIDLLEPQMVAASFRGMAPSVANEASLLDQQQSGIVLGVVSDRLSMLGTRSAGGGRLTVVGSPETLLSLPGQTLSGSSAAQLSFASSLAPSSRAMGRLPENVSGFISGGFSRGGSAFAQSGFQGGRDTWHMAMGLEFAMDDALTFGSAFGHVNGISRFAGSEAEAITNQAAFYGSYRLGGGFYAGGMAAISHTRLGVQRSASLGSLGGMLAADTSATSYDLQAELGVNLDTGTGIMLTPRAQIGYKSYNMGRYRENGGGELALMVDGVDLDRVEARLGVKMSGSLGSARAWTFSPEIRADWVSALANGADSFNVRFAQAPDIAFALPMLGRDSSWGEIKGGIRMVNGPVAFRAGVESSFARSDFRDDRAVLDFAYRF